MEQKPKYLLIVKVAAGIVSRRTPRSQAQGGVQVRAIAVGTALYAHVIINVDGVRYANILPQNPIIPEWVRVAEKDNSIEYVDVIELEDAKADESIRELASAVTLLATAVRELAKR